MSHTGLKPSAAVTSAIDIRPVTTAQERKTFIRLANAIYAGDPHYVAPLEFEIGGRLNGESNPNIKGSPHQLWIAYSNGAPVGRIGAIVNRAHLERHQDGAGHFGYFECIDDQDTAGALLNTAADWLRQQGMTKIGGPYNFSVNEEVGMLIDGFDTPPYIMMPHGRRYYPQMMETMGFSKAADLIAFSYKPKDELMPAKRKRFLDRALDNPKVSFRNINMKDFKNEIKTLVDIFNAAWFDNWGFVPFTREQVEHMADELRPIISPHNVVFCDYDGKPAAFGLVLPDINYAIRDFGGKLLPFNWAKLLWRLKMQPMPRARMPLMGVTPNLHRRPIGTALAYKIIELMHEANVARGVVEAELSWILESNASMVAMLVDLGGKPYKTYRIYEKSLEQ